MRHKLGPPLVAILIALAGPAAAQANRSPVAKPQPDTAAAIVKQAMIFYLATGEEDACGQGCREWIAAEGQFDPAAAQRFKAILARLGRRKLPVFFHSSGGIQGQAFEIGRLLRKRDMTAGVSMTIPAGCIGGSDQTCKMLKQSGQTLAAELVSVASCNSACVYALIGAKVRHVPPGARLGVHSGKLIRLHSDGRVKFVSNGSPSSRDKAKTTEHAGKTQRYVNEMGIDARMFQIISKVPYEQVYHLSRDEIAGFGIDSRDFLETRWTALEMPPRPLSVLKFILEAKVGYYRGLRSDEFGTERSIKLAFDGRLFSFPQKTSISKIDAIDTGGTFDTRVTHAPFEFFEAAATHDRIDIIESDPASPTASSRITKLSTSGLSKALEQLRKMCSETPMHQGSKPNGRDAKRLGLRELGFRRGDARNREKTISTEIIGQSGI
jgi:hypothetical protein